MLTRHDRPLRVIWPLHNDDVVALQSLDEVRRMLGADHCKMHRLLDA